MFDWESPLKKDEIEYVKQECGPLVDTLAEAAELVRNCQSAVGLSLNNISDKPPKGVFLYP